MASPKHTKQQELLQLGEKLQNFYDSGYVNKRQAILFSFYKGLASGMGAFLGGTIIAALLLWLLSLLSQVPFLPHFVNVLRSDLHK